MNASTQQTEAPASTEPETPAGPSVRTISPGLLVLGFLLNALLAMGMVLGFGRLRGIDLLTAVTLLTLTGVVLGLLAAHQILLVAVRASSSDDDRREQFGLFGLLRREWKVLRDGTPDEPGLPPEKVFVGTLYFVLLFVGASVVLCLEGSNSWPKLSPLVDVLGIVAGGGLLARIFSLGWNRFQCALRFIGQVVTHRGEGGHPQSASFIRWSLLTAGHLLTCAYGLVVVSRFTEASGCPFALAFIALSAMPLSLFGVSVAVLLAPALAVLEKNGTENTEK